MRKILCLLLFFVFMPNAADAVSKNRKLYDEEQERKRISSEEIVKQAKFREEEVARDAKLSDDLKKTYEQQQITNVLIRDLMKKILELETKIEDLQLQLDRAESNREVQYIDR